MGFTRCEEGDPLFQQMACFGFIIFAFNLIILLVLYWRYISPSGKIELEEDIEAYTKSGDMSELDNQEAFIYHLPLHYKNLKCSSVREKRKVFLALTQFNASTLPPIIENIQEDESSLTISESESKRPRRVFEDFSNVFEFKLDAYPTDQFVLPEGRVNLLDQFFIDDDDQFEPSYFYPPDIELSEEV